MSGHKIPSKFSSYVTKAFRLFWGATSAALAFLGAAPLVLMLLVKAPFFQRELVKKATALASAQGISAQFDASFSLLPLKLVLRDVVVDGKDGLGPAIRASYVMVRPKFFTLLSGQFKIDTIEANHPQIRIAIRDKYIETFQLSLPEEKEKKEGDVFRAPFDSISLSDAEIDAHYIQSESQLDVHVHLYELDADLTARDDPFRGSSFDLVTYMTRGTVSNKRTVDPPKLDVNAAGSKPPSYATFDDEICELDARIHYEPDVLVVRRFSAHGSVDDDGAEATFMGCGLSESDPHFFKLGAGHSKIILPDKLIKDSALSVQGRFTSKIPLRLLKRFPFAPDVDGSLTLDAEVDASGKGKLPEARGHLSGENLRVEQYSFAKKVDVAFQVHHDVVTASEATVSLASGVVSLRHIEVKPFEDKVPIRAVVAISNIKFDLLMRDLGVSPHAHVGWLLQDIAVPELKGTLLPLELDGELSAKTHDFALYNSPVDDPSHKVLIGFKHADLQSHLAVRPNALLFERTSAQVGKSKLEGGMVSIGFDQDLKLEVQKAHVDLTDISPIAGIPIGGVIDAQVNASGKFNDVVLTAEGKVEQFDIADLPFGDVTQLHVKYRGTTVWVSEAKGIKNSSHYDMPAAKLEFGPPSNFAMDAEFDAETFDARDLLSIFHMEKDPKFREIEAKVNAHGSVRIVLGGPEDVCSGGLVDLQTLIDLHHISLFGERFEDAHAELRYKWVDRFAGTEGAEVDVRSFALHKLHPAGKLAVGSIFGSALVKMGGKLHANFTFDGLPLSTIDGLGQMAGRVDGTIGGVAAVNGTLNQFQLVSDIKMSPLLIQKIPFQSSKFHLAMTEDSKKTVIGKTQCGNPIHEKVDEKERLKANYSSGEFVIEGKLFGSQLEMIDVHVSRQEKSKIRGLFRFHEFDLSSLKELRGSENEDQTSDTNSEFSGRFSGDVKLEEYVSGQVEQISLRIEPSEAYVQAKGQSFSLSDSSQAIVLQNNELKLERLQFDLRSKAGEGRSKLPTKDGFVGGVVVSGSIHKVMSEPSLDLALELLPIDLRALGATIPKVSRASGRFTGSFTLKGPLMEPDIGGGLKLEGGQFLLPALPSAITDVNVEILADKDQLIMKHADCKFLGGDLHAKGVIPLRGSNLFEAEFDLQANHLSWAPQEGLRVTLGADLHLVADLLHLSANTDDNRRLPKLTGVVDIENLEYTRAVGMTLIDSLRQVGSAQRIEADVYDPAQDFIFFELRVRSLEPLRIRNNFAEMQLHIGKGGLLINGTNQHVGARGEVNALAGGKLQFFSNEFDVRQAHIRFEDSTRIAPYIDATAVTDYRRASATSGSNSSGRAGGQWRIQLRAFGPYDGLQIEMTSEPTLTKEDITLLLTAGVTRAELDGSAGSSLLYEAVGQLSGADREVKKIIPIDDFRFGSWYSPRTGRTDPNLTIGQKITPDVTVSGTSGISGTDTQLRGAVDVKVSGHTSAQASWDNINSLGNSGFGNAGGGFRWRLEFQ